MTHGAYRAALPPHADPPLSPPPGVTEYRDCPLREYRDEATLRRLDGVSGQDDAPSGGIASRSTSSSAAAPKSTLRATAGLPLLPGVRGLVGGLEGEGNEEPPGRAFRRLEGVSGDRGERRVCDVKGLIWIVRVKL